MSTSPHDPWGTLRPGSPAWHEAVAHLGAQMLVAAVTTDPGMYRDAMAQAARLPGRWDATMLIGWIDTALAHVGEPAAGASVALAFAHPDGTRIDVDTVAADLRWAARLMAARAVLDHDTVAALLAEPVDDDTWARRIVRVLELAAQMLRGPGHYYPAAPRPVLQPAPGEVGRG